LRTAHRRLLICGGLAAAILCAGAATAQPLPSSTAAAEAARIAAREELDAMHTVLLEAHPGAIDDENPSYRERIETAYRAALGRVKDAQDQHDVMSVADAFLAPFQDVHLAHTNGVNAGDTSVLSGWMLKRAADGRARVAATVQDWPVALPPIGAELVACDGHATARMIEEDVAPFITYVDAQYRDGLLLARLSWPAMAVQRKASCTFRLAQGEMVELAQFYRHATTTEVRSLFASAGSAAVQPPHVNDMELLPDRTLWIRAGDFQLNARSEKELQHLLERLEATSNPRRIVFDLRGNAGGSSSIGTRIFAAATGGLVYDETGLDALPKTRAWWRVSRTDLEAQDDRIAYITGRLGSDDPIPRMLVELRARMQAALDRGEHWIPQDDGEPLVTPAEMVRRHAHLARFDGQVILLTDNGCVSACLDMADLVRLVPGVLHVGETTGFDSVYLELGQVKLPSGNWIKFPMKVWRHRLRGNDQPWVPQVPIVVTGRDNKQVQADVLAAADRRGH